MTELRAGSADAPPQLAADRTHESRMDEFLRSRGFYRKKIAKDGSCLFRAVAEQVLHCQSLHTEVRTACVNYLRQHRSSYELFIEGNFEKYLENLQDPQSWVGQVEISALAELYKHDFIIFQEPDQPPVNITENGFTDKVRLCFLNGNHYDSVYPESFEKSAAVCQSILYELLYDGVCGADRSVIGSCVKGGRAQNKLDSEECKSSEESDLEEEEFWSGEVREKATNGMNVRPPQRGRGRGQTRGRGRGFLSTKVQKSLNPALYRNVEYDVWLRSKRLQQQRDFCMAAGMQYSVGDKCKVQLSGSNRLYNAYVQEVSPDNGPVTVFIEELNRQQTVPLLSLRLPSEESWHTVSERGKRYGAPNNGAHTQSEWESRGRGRPSRTQPPSAPAARVQKQHSWPPQATAEDARNKSRRSDQPSSPVCILPEEEQESAVLELLHKDEHNFPSLGASNQMATASEIVKKGGEKRGSRKKEQRESISETEMSQKPVQRQKSTTEEKNGIKVSEEPAQKPSPSIKEKLQEKPAPLTPSQSLATVSVSGTKRAPSSSQAESTTAPSLNQSTPEVVKKTTVQTKSSAAQIPDLSQFSPVSPSAALQSASEAAAVSFTAPSPIQSMPAPKPTNPLLQIAPVPVTVAPTPEIISQPPQAPSQITLVGPVLSQITPIQVPAATPTQTPTLAPSGSVPVAPVESTPSIQSDPPASIPAPTLVPTSAIPVSAPAQVSPLVLEATEPSSTTHPVDECSGLPVAQKTVDPHTTLTPVPLSQAPPTTVSPSYGPVQSPPPDLPQSMPTVSDPHPCETSAIPATGVAPVPDQPLQPKPFPFPQVQWSQLLQDPVYPGFPQNEKGEVEPLPSFSHSKNGEDLPQDINVLRFFFNLGVKAYSQPMFPPIVYLGPLNQAYQIHFRGPPPSDSAANPSATPWQPENPSPPQTLSSIPDSSLDSHTPIAPVAVGNSPACPIEMGRFHDPPSLPMHVQPRPPTIPWSAASGQSTYPGGYPAAPPMQFSSPPCPPPGNQMYPPSAVGYPRMSFPPMPLEALNHGPPGRMDVLPFIRPTMDRGQENGQMSMNPQFGSIQKTAGYPGSQPHLSGGDFKPQEIPVSMGSMEPPNFGGPLPIVQPFQITSLQGDTAGLTPLVNGNLARPGGVYPKGLHVGPVGEDPSHLIHAYSPDDNWSEEMEFPNVDLRVAQSFYRGGGRRGQEDRGGYRGRSLRGRKEYSVRGRQDDQSYYRQYGRRGVGPRIGAQLPYQ